MNSLNSPDELLATLVVGSAVAVFFFTAAAWLWISAGRFAKLLK